MTMKTHTLTPLAIPPSFFLTFCLPLLSIFFFESRTFAQGTVNFLNTSTTPVRTNATALGGSAGNTAASPGGFYYALCTAQSTVVTLDASLQDLLTPTWTFTGIYATNTAAS